ncbi:MAG: hypothetical protein CSA62_12880 [Planctomycetota bacterium]|nr:MAG: hypothetical protein CSA62_12880 [Planctomycetota bacterium]
MLAAFSLGQQWEWGAKARSFGTARSAWWTPWGSSALFEVCEETDFDLFVYAASFVDEAWAAEAGIQPHVPVDPSQPMQAARFLLQQVGALTCV